MIPSRFSSVRPFLVPVGIVLLSVASIFLLRKIGSGPRAADLMQSEMNRQHDRFQKNLADATDALLQMQRRMVLSEQSRDGLKTLYANAQAELVQTQDALRMANQALTNTETALRNTLEGYNALMAKVSGAPPAMKPPVAAVRTDESIEAEVLRKTGDLQRLRQQITIVADAVGISGAYVERLRAAHDGMVRMLDESSRAAGREPTRTAQLERPVTRPAVAVGPATLDVPPGSVAEPHARLEWVNGRVKARSGELVALHNELTIVNREVETLQAWLGEQQRKLDSLP